MKTKFLPLAMLVIFAGCSKKENVETLATINENAVSLSAKATLPSQINFTQQNLFPEGVVYDKFNSRFYVSSITSGDIGIVKSDGSYEVFIDDPALTATTGLEIDAARKLLYVSNSAGSVGIYDLGTGERVNLVNLAALTPGVPVFINDIALDPQGNAYATSSFGSIIYKISTYGTASIFFQDPRFTTGPGQFGFNGIEYGNSHGGYLITASSVANQVIKIPLSDPASAAVISLDAPLAGPDGLLLSNDGKQLIIVNNSGGGPGRVLSFTTTDNWETATLNSTFNTGSVFPTTATTDGKEVFVLYAYLNRRMAGQSEFTIQKIPLANTNNF